MAQKKKNPYSFFLVASGLLIGFFLGAAIIFLFHNQPAGYQLTDAAMERVNRLFQQEAHPPASDPAPAINPALTIDPAPAPNPALTPGQPPAQEGTVQSPSGEGIPLRSLSAEQNTPEPFPLPADTTGFGGADETPGTSPEPLEAPSIVSPTEPDSLAFKPDPGEPHSRGILGDEIRVQRDRLVGTLGFTLPEAAPSASESASTKILDSLLGGRQGQPYRTIQVEFWESPLHFSGYKMSKNSLILYGLDQIESVSLLMHEEIVFLKYHGIYFPLALTSEFLPLTAIDDPLLINKLEQQWP